MTRVSLLDYGYLELVESWGSDETIVTSARMSTGKAFLGWGPHIDPECKRHSQTSPLGSGSLLDHSVILSSSSADSPCTCKPGDEKLLRRLFEKKHTSPFEMAGATFEIQAPIMVFREWHRHRTQSYSEMSARYAPLPDMNYVPSISRLMMKNDANKQATKAAWGEELTEATATEWLDLLEGAYSMCETVYQQGLAAGVPKELARLIVPVGRYSRMRATANLHNWLRFLRLRLPDDAQWEIRSYAAIVAEMLSDNFPRTMALFGEELLEARPEPIGTLQPGIGVEWKG